MVRTGVVAVAILLALWNCGQAAGESAASKSADSDPSASAAPLLTINPQKLEDDLRLLNQHLKRREVLHAKVLYDQLLNYLPANDQRLAGCGRLLERQMSEQQVQVSEGYLWLRKPPENDPEWKAVLENAEKTRASHSKYHPTLGLSVLRIYLEAPELEQRVAVMGQGLNHSN